MDFKKAVGVCLIFFGLAITPLTAESKSAYEKSLKKWTRDAQVYTWDNFETRLVWHATYLSSDFRAARRERLNDLYEWSGEELSRKVREDAEDEGKNDVFLLVVYAGSSKWPEVGKDDGQWRIRLEPEGRAPVESVGLERLPVTAVDRVLYPFIDKWSKVYLARFPKVLHPGVSFRLHMSGVPAKSELVWAN